MQKHVKPPALDLAHGCLPGSVSSALYGSIPAIKGEERERKEGFGNIDIGGLGDWQGKLGEWAKGCLKGGIVAEDRRMKIGKGGGYTILGFEIIWG